MKLFTDSRGITWAFGFDMETRRPSRGKISWDDGCGNWQSPSGGWIVPQSHCVEPEFVIEKNGVILAYQPGLMVEISYIGPPMDYSLRFLTPDR